MRKIALIAVLIVGCLGTFAQERIDPEYKTLFEQLSNDNTFKIIQRNMRPTDLTISNAYKQELYMAYLNKTPNILKVFKREQVGLEGQYTKTYFIVDHGKVKIVEAYFGDPSGSKELQYIHVYTPEEIKLGYLDKDWKFIPLSDSEIPKDKELFIGYFVASGRETRRF
jgi:hypothetical protein